MAVSLTETDVFQYLESSGARLKPRMNAIITNRQATTVVNEALEVSTLSRFGATFKEPIALKALLAVRSGDLVLFVAKPEYNLMECLPFFRYTIKGKAKVAVNLTNIITVETDENGNESYMVDDMRKLYAMLISAYLNLIAPEPEKLPIKCIEYGAMMWARMFCKVLNRSIGLSSSKERYEAYFYFAARFFLIYLVGAPDATVDSISLSMLSGRIKTPLIAAIEDAVAEQKLDMYGSLTDFCNTLFNNDISGVKGMRMVAANPGEKLNFTFFMRRFIDTYNQSSLMALASLPYFTWMVVCTQRKAYLCNIKMLGDVLDGVEGSKYLAGLYSQIS